MTRKLTGTIRRENGSPLADAVVQVLDRISLHREVLLGEATTDRNGRYAIDYELDGSRRPDRRRAHLFIRVFDDEGLLGQSDVVFDAPAEATIDLTAAPPGEPLAEVERLRQAQAQFGDGRLLDEADIDFLAGASEISRGLWRAWQQATRLAEGSGLPAPMLYALVRQDGDLDLDGLLDRETADVSRALAQAVADNVISDRAAAVDRWLERLESLRQTREARRRALFDRHQAVGRLLDADDGEPLAGFAVQATLLGDQPEALGYDITDGRGLFGVSYVLPPDTPEDDVARPVRLTVLNPAGEEIHQTEMTITPDPEQVFDVSVLVPESEARPSPNIEELDLDLSAELRGALERHNIRTLADVRRRGGLHGLHDLADNDVVETLEAHARLDALSIDATTRSRLIGEGLTDVSAIANTPRSRFVSKFTDGEGGEAQALEAQAAAQAHLAVANNHLAKLQVAAANGSWGLEPEGPTIPPNLKELLKPKCGCPDCESAVSPLAYLADLVDYALNHLENNDQSIAIDFLEQNFHQPFSRLPATCEAMEAEVRQVRLCIEVLRSYLAAKDRPQGARAAALTAAEAQYRLDAYTTLLTELGTSYADLRLARAANRAERLRLAEQLGIAAEHLDDLFLPVRARPPELTETRLEALFGLVDTSRDPLAEGREPLFLQWRLDYLRDEIWHQQDWPKDAPEDQPEDPPEDEPEDPSEGQPDDVRPLIDPDVIGPAHFVDPQLGDPAFSLWQKRRDQIDGWLDEVDETRQAADSPLTGLETIVEAFVGVPMSNLLALVEKSEAGEDIEPDLIALHLTLKAWRYLLRVHRLAEREAVILEDEWEEVYNILVQVRKVQHFAAWRDEERERELLLSPDFFKLPLRSTGTVPPPQAPPLPQWRATESDRRDWEDLLEGRIEQEQAVVDALEAAVSAAEEATLPTLRDALILATITNDRISFDRQAKFLGDILLIDTKTDGCQETTRISQAIETVQGILWASRNRLLEDEYPDLDLNDDDFDERWQWLGSYATWRTAMFVFLYPENILHPNLRRRQTPAFRRLVSELRADRRLNPERARDAAARYADYFTDVTHLTPEAACQTRTRLYTDGVAKGYAYKLFVFARADETGKTYWSACAPQGSGFAQSFWSEVPGLIDVQEIIGATPYSVSDDERYIYLFVRQREGVADRLVYLRFNLETATWEGGTSELDLPEQANRFSAVTLHRETEDRPPQMIIRMPHGAIYRRSLSQNGRTWDGEGWALLFGATRGFWLTLQAFLEVKRGQTCLIVTDIAQSLVYRFLGDFDDGSLRPISVGQFQGAFKLPGTNGVHVFYRRSGENFYRLIVLRESWADSELIETPEGLRNWLWNAAGASLKKVIFPEDKTFTVEVTYTKNWLETGTFRFQPIYVGGKTLWYVLTELIEGSGPIWGQIRRSVRQQAIQWLVERVASAEFVDETFGPWRLADQLLREFSVTGDDLASALTKVFSPKPGSDVIAAIQGDPTKSELRIRQRSHEGEQGLEFPAREGIASGIRRVLPSGGRVDEEDRLFCYWRGYANGLYRCRFETHPLLFGALSEGDTGRLAPVVTLPFTPDERLSETELEVRGNKIAAQYEVNREGPLSNLTYLAEAYYYIPVLLAEHLRRRGHFTSALDWYRTVYDYGAPLPQRRIFSDLETGTRHLAFARHMDWLLDPLNPHAVAATRPDTYTRYTVLSIIHCILDYAAAEFARDTAESVPRARQLYLAALDLLQTPELKSSYEGCNDLVGNIAVTVGDPYWAFVAEEVKQELTQVTDVGVLTTLTNQIHTIFSDEEAWPEKIAQARSLIAEAVSQQQDTDRLGPLLSMRTAVRSQALTTLEGDETFARLARRVEDEARRVLRHSLSWITGLRADVLATESVTLPFLANKRRRESGDGAMLVPASDRTRLREDFRRLPPRNPLVQTRTSALLQVAQTDPIASLKITARIPLVSVPAPSFAFCIPRNPILNTLRLRAELNLHKIRTCLNIAGIKRELVPYAAPTDTVSGLPKVGAGGQLVLPGTGDYKPTPYRYAVLVERARQLVALAQQVESQMLASIEKGEAEQYTLLKARQDAQLARSSLRLRMLNLGEARQNVTLSTLQQERAQIQVDHYERLLDMGISDLEYAALALLETSLAVPDSVGVSIGAQFGASVSFSPSGKLQTQSQIHGAYASYERREQDWTHLKILAQQDKRIGEQLVSIAKQRVRVVEQERLIAQMQADHAQEVVDFLSNKFTNVELYDWMSGVLEGVYSHFLQNATAMAKLAAQQLAFERQETPPPFIQADYWEAPADFFSGEELGKAPDRRGLTGSARLLQDIHQLDQYAFDTDQRKLQLTKTISLAQMAPAEFQRFRETGVMAFATPMELFDRDFPGHYLRLVRRVRTSVIALIPPNQGIRATLSTTGTSRVVIGGDVFQEVVVNHGPQSVALSSPRDATGLFELDTQPEMLLPFEGLGVDTTWEFRMPKAANRFDYDTIADVLITIEYTALNDFTYRQQVVQELNDRISADRAFSFRHEFADQWYDLHHPDQSDTPMTVRFETSREDFPPNIENLRIEHVVMYFARKDGVSADEVTVDHLQFTPLESQDGSNTLGGGSTTVDGIISTRKLNGSSWLPITGHDHEPSGMWELALPNPPTMRKRFEEGEIEDILLVITYRGRTPAWPV